ncbi:MAG TPA: nickel pincer cofactor biosynthesis protein LarB [Planctomycetota bacterium]|nr:nickel pincer cofactor biosynthesis protein LarB [Planctomycetota bacterium]
MDPKKLRALLAAVRDKKASVDQALASLAALPFSDLDIAKVDHHRALRCGFAEVIFGSGKTTADVLRICESALEHAPCVLITRVNDEQASALLQKFPGAVHNARGRTVRVGKPQKLKSKRRGDVHVVTAGTSDIPVAEEALETLHAFGCGAKKHYDVGVAGLHRVLKVVPDLQSAGAVICIAGMEGALPSVVGGLVACPVIAVPTSIGYGASLNGITALLSMLNTCASGVSVVNVDNGFGAAMCALRIMRD